MLSALAMFRSDLFNNNCQFWATDEDMMALGLADAK
jgi:hypothetical protein